MNVSVRLLIYSYTLLHYAALPGIFLRLLWRSRYTRGYRQRWKERFGFIKPISTPKSIWIHAVSVGEIIAAVPLIKEIKQRYPQHTIVVTTTTPTGSAQAIKHFRNEIKHVYAPMDLPAVVKRFLQRVKPELVIIMETELWPNILLGCNKRHIPVMLANARMSERSRRGYQLIRPITKNMLNTFHVVAAQGSLDAKRILSLGLDPNKLLIAGNIKFDIHIPESVIEEGRALRHAWNSKARPTLIAASTHEDEESIILEAFKKIRLQFPNSLLVIVPRHPDNFDKVARLCEEKGFHIARRSLAQNPTSDTDVLLGDTIGELRMLYIACDIAFVGGSLVPAGGHNLIEPAAVGLPVLTGPHLFNFTEMSKLLNDASALQIVTDIQSITDTVNSLFTSTELRQQMGAKAQEVIDTNRGALSKHLDWIQHHFQISNIK